MHPGSGMANSDSGKFIEFSRISVDPAGPLARIGQGEIGGKAHGLARVRGALFRGLDHDRFPDIHIDIPPLAVICTGVFAEFMAINHLDEIASAEMPDERIARAFQKADLPFEVLGDLWALINHAHSPLAIRSSSLLEDTRREPFAGVYVTKMIPNESFDPQIRFRQLTEAIKHVFASTYFSSAKDYRTATGHRDDEEQMAVIIQEVVGKRHPHRFYPDLSGVGRSINHYPMDPAKPEDGVVNLALGLGKLIVDGGRCWAYSPAYPNVQPPYGSVEQMLKETQTEFWAVNMGEVQEYDPIHETEYLLFENLTTAERDGSLRYLASTYSPISGRLSIGTGFDGPRVLTFAPLLALDQIPINDLISEIMDHCAGEYGGAVEIEFAMTFDPHRFAFLQVRPMNTPGVETKIEDSELRGENVLVACEHSLGNGVDESLLDIVYTKPENFDLKHTRKIMAEMEDINRELLQAGRHYLLIVLGRLGTTDPWLGIPIGWAKIGMAKAVVESTGDKARVALSQGSHFFHNITSLGVKYFTLSLDSKYEIDWKWLGRQKAAAETEFLRHIRLDAPLTIKVDGRSSRGVIIKPGAFSHD
jgi:phosphoenolpyruvate synthase/pyruvate phosphate dikinase